MSYDGTGWCKQTAVIEAAAVALAHSLTGALSDQEQSLLL